MRRTIILLSLLTLVSPLCAEDAKPQPKPRTLPELIDYAMKVGKESSIPGPMADKLGFGKSAVVTKRILYKKSEAPDKLDHSLDLVMGPQPNGPLKPVGLVWNVTSGQRKDGVLYIDGYILLSSLDGNLQRAFHNKGKKGDVDSSTISIYEPDTKSKFAKEVDFHLRDVVRLGLQPLK